MAYTFLMVITKVFVRIIIPFYEVVTYNGLLY